MNNHYKKYLKYKQKYLELKNDKINQKGGRSIRNYNNINRFSTIEYPEMEEFLNPIYGCFLAESDFIRNNYFLYKANIDLDELRLNDNFELSDNLFIINNNLRQKIDKLTHNISSTPIVTPTNEIKTLTPLDIVCERNNIDEKKYPDCGETTRRKLINLICFDTKTRYFNLQILQNYGTIQELIEYYIIFLNFIEQSSNNKKDIYGLKLNARDGWCYLIIHHANTNLTFNEYCSTNNFGYNLHP